MCFYHEYDWSAEVYERDEGAAGEKCRCVDCRRQIHVGETVTHFYLREREECECGAEFGETGPCDFDDGEPHNFGEEDEFDVCGQCVQVRRAIRAQEESEGCSGGEAEPSYGELQDAICNDDEGKYAAKVLEMFPDLGPHLAKLGYEDKAVQS